MSAIVALLTFVFGPSSHTIGRAASAVLAFQNESATTATPVSPTGMTFLTPRMFWIFATSKLFILPPAIGQSRIVEVSMPGNFRSMP